MRNKCIACTPCNKNNLVLPLVLRGNVKKGQKNEINKLNVAPRVARDLFGFVPSYRYHKIIKSTQVNGFNCYPFYECTEPSRTTLGSNHVDRCLAGGTRYTACLCDVWLLIFFSLVQFAVT